MGRVFKTKLRFKAGGTMDNATGIMTGGTVLGHFMTTVRLQGTRTVLTSKISAGPTVQDTDEDDITSSLEIELDTSSDESMNVLSFAIAGGPVEVTNLDGTVVDDIQKFAPYKFGDFGATGQKEAATQTVTLVGTNGVLEADWIAAQDDLGDGGG